MLSAHQMAPGRSTVLRSQDECTEMVDDKGACVGASVHCAWLVLEEPGHAALPVAPALGVVAVEEPQIQFLGDGWWDIGFDSGYMVCVSSWVLVDGFFHIFYVKNSRILRSLPRTVLLQLLPCAGHTWKLDTLRIRAPQRLFQFLSEMLVKVCFFCTFSPPNKSAKVHGQVSARVHSSELSSSNGST